jgi:hypothetical protein
LRIAVRCTLHNTKSFLKIICQKFVQKMLRF